MKNEWEGETGRLSSIKNVVCIFINSGHENITIKARGLLCCTLGRISTGEDYVQGGFCPKLPHVLSTHCDCGELLTMGVRLRFQQSTGTVADMCDTTISQNFVFNCSQRYTCIHVSLMAAR